MARAGAADRSRLDALGVRAAPSPASYIVWDFALMGALVVALFAALSLLAAAAVLIGSAASDAAAIWLDPRIEMAG